MKTQCYKLILVPALLLLSTLNPQFSTVFAQGTAFTYQGRLFDGNGPANGKYNLTFALYATNSGGTMLAGPVTNSATAVSNGLFRKEEFRYDAGSDIYLCPSGQRLEPRYHSEVKGACSGQLLQPRGLPYLPAQTALHPE